MPENVVKHIDAALGNDERVLKFGFATSRELGPGMWLCVTTERLLADVSDPSDQDGVLLELPISVVTAAVSVGTELEITFYNGNSDRLFCGSDSNRLAYAMKFSLDQTLRRPAAAPSPASDDYQQWEWVAGQEELGLLTPEEAEFRRDSIAFRYA